MKPTTRHAIQLSTIVVGTFSVATLSNLTANYITSENPEQRKKSIAFATTGLIASGILIYYLNKTKLSNGN